MNSLTSSMNASNTSCRKLRDVVVRTTITGRSSTESSGSSDREHLGGICPSGMETGKRCTTDSDAGPKMVLLSRSYGIFKGNSTQRAVSIGASSMWIAPSYRPPEPPLADQTMIKRGPKQAGRRRRPGARLQPRWVLYKDTLAYRPTRPPSGSRPVGRAAPRVGLLHRPNERSIGPPPKRTAPQTPRGSRWRPWLRRCLDPPLARRTRHRVGHPGSQGCSRRPWAPTNLR